MTLKSPDELTSEAAELFRSLQRSIRDLRQMAEDLRLRIGTGGEADLTRNARDISGAEALIRACQKMEICLVEQQYKQAGIVQGGYALDLERARDEIGCRLARLRACRDA